MNENTAVTGGEHTNLSVFSSTDSFELAQRAGKMLAASDLVPEQFRGNVANCVIALNIAHRLGADPFAVLQSLYIVHGRPSWSAQFLIGLVNSSGRFTPLQFRMEGEGATRSCAAHAKHIESGETVTGPVVSIEMAKAEGWYGKKGSKWQTMPELMLNYRAGAFFCRIYAPDLTLGMRTAEEEHDIVERDSTPRASSPLFKGQETETYNTGGRETAAVVIDAVEEPKKDGRSEALGVVLGLITATETSTLDIESVLRKRGVMGATGSIPRLGEAKLKDIAADWDSIEGEALLLSVDPDESGPRTAPPDESEPGKGFYTREQYAAQQESETEPGKELP